jgi:hypothetical protein
MLHPRKGPLIERHVIKLAFKKVDSADKCAAVKALEAGLGHKGRPGDFLPQKPHAEGGPGMADANDGVKRAGLEVIVYGAAHFGQR